MTNATVNTRASRLSPKNTRLAFAHAFSLVELVVVIAIVGVLSAMAIPRFGGSLANQRADSLARRLASHLELVRQHAMATSTSTALRIRDRANPSYELVGMPHPDHPARAFIVYFSETCDGAEIASFDLGGDFEILFDMYGVPDTRGAITIRVGSYQRLIGVDDITGVVSISE